jgi:predicted transcriptional regulator
MAAMTGKSGRGTARQTIRVDEDLWDRFGQASETQHTDRSVLLREFIARYVRRYAPKRGPQATDSGGPDGGE